MLTAKNNTLYCTLLAKFKSSGTLYSHPALFAGQLKPISVCKHFCIFPLWDHVSRKIGQRYIRAIDCQQIYADKESSY